MAAVQPRSFRPELTTSAHHHACLRQYVGGFYDGTMAKSPLSLAPISLIFSGVNNTKASSDSPRIPLSISSSVPVLPAMLQETCLLDFARRGRYFSLFLPYSTIIPLYFGTVSFSRAPNPQRAFDLISFRASPLSLEADMFFFPRSHMGTNSYCQTFHSLVLSLRSRHPFLSHTISGIF
jgi:hypothetical protein